MWDLLRVSIRNVSRNKRRALITTFTVFLGVVVVTGTRGLLNGLQGEIRSGLTRKVNGDLQIHVRGYADSLESNPYKILMPFDGALKDKVLSDPGVAALTPRLRVMALLNHQKSQTSTPVLLTAIHSTSELEVCPRFAQTLQQGRMLDHSLEKAVRAQAEADPEEAVPLDEADGAVPAAGAAPREGGFHQILLTPALMRGLSAEVGDEIVLLLQDRDGMQQALVTTLTGVIELGLPNMGARMAWVDMGTLQRAAAVGALASDVVIRVKDGVDEAMVKRRLQAALGDGVVVETWLELGGFFRDVMGLQNAIFSIVLLIVFVIVISAIVNTSFMTVMERTREIGTLMALGYRRRHIVLLFLGESAVIGFGGGLAGLGFATIMLAVLHRTGIDMTLPGAAVPTVLHPFVPPSFLILVLALAVSSALMAGLFPAWRASHMKPVEALATV